MDILGFYKNGARVVVRGSGSDRSKSFSGGLADVEIGAIPADNARRVSGPASDVVEHRGVKHLVLNAGHIYEVSLKVGSVEKNDVVSAEHGHVAVALPKDAVVVSVQGVVDSQPESAEEQ